ncbi:ATP-binding protein, partial [Limosilactobacillus reuteri]
MNQYQKLVDKEIAYQQQKSLKRRIKRARFPIIKLLSDFDYQFQPSINQQ